jgi:hypothetical protein
MVNKKSFVVVPTLYIIISFLLIYIFDFQTTAKLTAEDSLFEYVTAIAFLGTSITFLLIFVHLRRTNAPTPALQKLAFLALAGIFFFGAGEEISWGQRLLNIETPEAIKAINEQDELTLHNLNILQGENKIPIGFSDLFNLFWFSLTLIIPLTALASARLRQLYESFTPVFPWIFGFLFLFNWGMAKIGGMIFRAGMEVSYNVNHMVEVKESGFSVLFVALALYTYFALTRNDHEHNLKTQPQQSHLDK